MTNNRILYVSQEIAPYLPSSPMADLGRNLAQDMHARGWEVRTFMPNYGSVNERRNQLHEVIRLSGLGIIIDDNDHPLIIKVASMLPTRIQVYFLDNDDFFQKSDDDEDAVGSNRGDNDERAIFFARGTAETVKKLRWEPKVVHCTGWITAMIPIYLRRIFNDDPAFKTTKIVYSVMPGDITGGVDERFMAKLKADGLHNKDLKKFAGMANDTSLLLKIGMEYANGIVFHDPEPPQALLEFAQQTGKPILLAADLEKGAEALEEFYKTLR